MLFAAMFVSILHLGWMNLLAFRRADYFLRICSACPLVLVLGCMPSMPLFLQAIVLGTLAVGCRRCAPKRPAIFLVSSIGCVIVIFGYAAMEAKSRQDNMASQFPLESMSQRVPAPKGGRPHQQLAEAASWSFLESNLDAELAETRPRANALRRLHEETTENFINSPGFGVMRMPLAPDPRRFDRELEEVKPIAQPDSQAPGSLSTEDLDRPYAGVQIDSLRRLHFGGLADFINFKGFGYVKDRDHAAGFRPHEFSRTPAQEDAPRIRRLELVSLLLHESPVVYVSEELPRMSALKKASTRSLSEFEARGIGELQKGEDLFVREATEGLLMLGAIRSVKQCVTCHGGERGDLLGAFSYSLTRTGLR